MVLTHCRSCQAKVVWMRSRQGNLLLVDLATVDMSATGVLRVLFDHRVHSSHFVKCPNVDEWRKKGARKKAVPGDGTSDR